MQTATVSILIDGRQLQAEAGSTILDAARDAGLYLPALCSHPSLPASFLPGGEKVYRGQEEAAADLPLPVTGCGLCLVEVDGEAGPREACATAVGPGLSVRTDSERLRSHRRQGLSRILAGHPHACLTCAQKEGCSRTQCSSNVPEAERCCEKLGRCELEKVAEYVGIAADTPRYRPAGLPVLRDEPLFLRDFNLCIGCRRCVRMCQEVRGVGALDFVWQSSSAIVGTIVPSLADAGCHFCGSCVEVCPTGATRDKAPLADKQTPPCRQACPLGLDIPAYVRLIGEERLDLAAAVIRQKLPFAAVLGRVCHHPCESACRRGQLNEPVAICSLKRFVTDSVPWEGNHRASPQPTGRRVAVVGAGPSGLTAAYFLAAKGHAVTVFEAMAEPGGMLRYGLAEHRLPRDVVEDEIDAILQSDAIELRTNSPVTLPGLQQQGYDAIYLAAGASQSAKIPLAGSDLPGVFWGLDFIRSVRSASKLELAGPVVVVGGGNVAVDVALTALRLAAGPVHMVCLESRPEMPAFEREIQEALAEGVIIHPSWGPKEVLGARSVEAIDFVRCTSVFDENKRFAPRFDESTTMRLEARSVILAIGQAPDLAFLDERAGLKPAPADTVGAGFKPAQGGGNGAAVENAGDGPPPPRVRLKGRSIDVDAATLAPSIPGVFAGGDVAGGIPAVVHAVAAGRKAAAAMDRYLGGDGEIDGPLPELPPRSQWLGRDAQFASRPRSSMSLLPLLDRVRGFGEIELGFERDAALREAQRCLQCDLRAGIPPAPLPPVAWLDLTPEVIATVPDCEGVIQLLDEDKEVVLISGTPAMRTALLEHLASGPAPYFLFEEEKMYTTRESELLQGYLSRHGRLPKGNDLPDDLF
ncbi:MAG: FAD-dependent oxidoreductase [Chloroflexota bacterium]|nr:FAD-dependent oxidoreductase [Chloroflexota bacterium]